MLRKSFTTFSSSLLLSLTLSVSAQAESPKESSADANKTPASTEESKTPSENTTTPTAGPPPVESTKPAEKGPASPPDAKPARLRDVVKESPVPATPPPAETEKPPTPSAPPPPSPVVPEPVKPPSSTPTSPAPTSGQPPVPPKPSEAKPPAAIPDMNKAPQANVQSSPNSAFPLGPRTQLVPNPPEHYVVDANDSVVNVLSKFVLDPLLAKEVWGQKMPDIRPGDIVSLIRQGNQPVLQIKRGRTVKLSPIVRVVKGERAIPIIRLETIRQFLNRPKVVAEEEIQNAGYVVANSSKTLMATVGYRIYARGLEEAQQVLKYIVVRPGQAYRDPEGDEVIAHEAIYLGDAKLEAVGDPATLLITSATREIKEGDRLLPIDESILTEDIRPHVPASLEGAHIIAVVDGVSQIGQYQIVVINKGLDDGMEIGHILVVNQGGRTVQDKMTQEMVTLPSQRSGILLIFRPFEKVSYALVMKAGLPINLLDQVTVP